MEWLNEQETINSYLEPDFSRDEKSEPDYSKQKIYNPQDVKTTYNSKEEQQHEIPLDEAQITDEQRELLRSNSLPVSEMYDKLSYLEYQTEISKTSQEIFLAKRFLNSHDTDVNGKIFHQSVYGTIYSRYSIFNNELEYIRADHLTEYHQSGSSQKRRKLESSFVRFDSIDQQTQKQIRMRLPEVSRTLSEEGLNFIASQFKKRFDQPPQNTGEAFTETSIGYGHLLSKEELQSVDLSKGISDSQAKEWLQKDLQNISDFLNQNLKIFVTQYEFDALISMASIHGVHSPVFITLLFLINAFQLNKACSYIEQNGFPKYRGKSESLIFLHGKYTR